MYYNTNNEKGETLKASERNTETQEQKVFELFKKYRELSASMAWRIYGPTTPLTSIRRAVTNLAKAGKIIKSQNLTPGVYGKVEHIYKLEK